MTVLGTGLPWAAAGGMAPAALVMVLTPGPNMIYLVSRSIAQGRVAGVVSLVGTGVGFLVFMTMANLGLSVVFVIVPWLYIGLKTAGVIYLAWLAFKTLRPGGSGLFELGPLGSDSRWRLFRMGMLTNLLNPKAAVMYLVIIPQFIDPGRGSVIAQGFTLGALQIIVSMIVNAAIVIAAGTIADFVAVRSSWLKWQRRITGSLFAAVAILLAKEIPRAAGP